MYQPDELKRSEPRLWSAGTGTDLWELFCACTSGDLATAKRLLDKDRSLVRAHHNYRKPLSFAVRNNRLAVATLLLEYDPHPADLSHTHSTIEHARDRGYNVMEQLLLGALINASPRGEPVAAAIRDRERGKVLRLLEAEPELVHAGDMRSNQPIHWAVMTRQLDLIDDLLARGADIESQRQDHARPIHLIRGDYHFRAWTMDFPTTPADVLTYLRGRGAYCDICTAAHSGDLSRVQELLDEDPTLVNFTSEYQGYYLGSGSPLKNAAAKGHIDIVRLLLARGANPSLPEEGIAPRGHALYSAVYNKHYDIAKLLLEHGAFPSPPVESSADALSMALLHNDQPMIALLCSYGATRSVELLAHYNDLHTAAAVFKVNPALADNRDAFPSAAGNGHEAFVRLMLRYAPELIKRVSCGTKTRALTEYLFSQGMDPRLPDWLGATPLHHFARTGNLEQAEVFLEHGAQLDVRDDEFCSTPLAWAARAGKIEMVEFLLDRGAKANLPDDPPWATPLAWSTRREHGATANLLQLRGAR